MNISTADKQLFARVILRETASPSPWSIVPHAFRVSQRLASALNCPVNKEKSSKNKKSVLKQFSNVPKNDKDKLFKKIENDNFENGSLYLKNKIFEKETKNREKTEPNGKVMIAKMKRYDPFLRSANHGRFRKNNTKTKDGTLERAIINETKNKKKRNSIENKNLIQCLKSKPVEELMSVVMRPVWFRMNYGVVIDGRVVSKETIEALNQIKINELFENKDRNTAQSKFPFGPSKHQWKIVNLENEDYEKLLRNKYESEFNDSRGSKRETQTIKQNGEQNIKIHERKKYLKKVLDEIPILAQLPNYNVRSARLVSVINSFVQTRKKSQNNPLLKSNEIYLEAIISQKDYQFKNHFNSHHKNKQSHKLKLIENSLHPRSGVENVKRYKERLMRSFIANTFGWQESSVHKAIMEEDSQANMHEQINFRTLYKKSNFTDAFNKHTNNFLTRNNENSLFSKKANAVTNSASSNFKLGINKRTALNTEVNMDINFIENRKSNLDESIKNIKYKLVDSLLTQPLIKMLQVRGALKSKSDTWLYSMQDGESAADLFYAHSSRANLINEDEFVSQLDNHNSKLLFRKIVGCQKCAKFFVSRMHVEEDQKASSRASDHAEDNIADILSGNFEEVESSFWNTINNISTVSRLKKKNNLEANESAHKSIHEINSNKRVNMEISESSLLSSLSYLRSFYSFGFNAAEMQDFPQLLAATAWINFVHNGFVPFSILSIL